MNLTKTVIFLSAFFCIYPQAKADNFSLSSPDIAENSVIKNDFVFNGFGCLGKNISPALEWKNAPKETKSFALTVYDPDAPTGSGWWHWIVINIPANISSLKNHFGNIETNSSPSPLIQQIKTDYGQVGYGGPCPPVGDKAHRYIFTLSALKVEKIELPENATAAMAGFFINNNTIEKTSFTALYSR